MNCDSSMPGSRVAAMRSGSAREGRTNVAISSRSAMRTSATSLRSMAARSSLYDTRRGAASRVMSTT